MCLLPLQKQAKLHNVQEVHETVDSDRTKPKFWSSVFGPSPSLSDPPRSHPPGSSSMSLHLMLPGGLKEITRERQRTHLMFPKLGRSRWGRGKISKFRVAMVAAYGDTPRETTSRFRANSSDHLARRMGARAAPGLSNRCLGEFTRALACRV